METKGVKKKIRGWEEISSLIGGGEKKCCSQFKWTWAWPYS
jgi:hypothetical protein